MTLDDWTMTVTGTILRIELENLDKSGRNPKYMLSFVVRPDGVDAPEEADLAVDVPIRIRDIELERLASTAPVVGDHVTMQARANGPRPATFYLLAIDSSVSQSIDKHG